MSDLQLAVIGNCSFGAMVDGRGRIVWACLPRFDADPIFCSLLNGNGDGDKFGFYEIELQDFARSEQQYLHNTAILVTTLYDQAGAAVEITDFAPRYRQYDRFYRPVMIIRNVRPVNGNPTIRVRLRPTYGYGLGWPDRTHGSNHIRYVAPDLTLRLTTDAPVSFVLDEVPFILEQPITLVLGPDESLTRSISDTGRDAFEKTQHYWREWTRFLSIPFEWQEAVIRAAITLKLSNFEESGAIVAAMTTSIPEAAGSGRNWDYRFCWLRDAYFVVHALNRLGATRTMEEYMGYILNVVATAGAGQLQPVYGITLASRLKEHVEKSLAGYREMPPVRRGNQAYDQIQNDVYGSVVLASTQAFFDERLVRPGTVQDFDLLENLGQQAITRYDQPDAGLWELRSRRSVHTFSSVMCWAACDRLAKIAGRLRLRAVADDAFDAEGLRRACAALDHGTAKDRERARAIRAWLDDPASRVEGFDAYKTVFLTKAEEPRAESALITKGARQADGEAAGILLREQARLCAVGGPLRLSSRADFWRQHANHVRNVVMENAWNAERNSFVASFGGDDIDASLLLLHELGFIEPTDPRFTATVEAVEKELKHGPFLFRYASPDDFGKPETAFNICTFWYIDALVALGRTEEARELFENMLACRNHVGLLSEDLDPSTRELWGNFPQTYSMVGLISSAMRLSKTWEEAF
jgi:GH15 family glucan-1,4-alpha-glucosidase